MTVCIAAICEWREEPVIVMVTDRQLTARDVKYDPGRSKLFAVTNTVAILCAGDDSANLTLCRRTQDVVREKRPEKIEGIADIYAEQFALLRRQRASRRFLEPRGLDFSTFIERQRLLLPEIAIRTDGQVTGDESDLGSEAIITGIDMDGPHIYKIDDPGEVTCEDGVAFAAIGEGYWHAESTLMGARYNWKFHASTALALAFTAKKRAELASSVGDTTDIFLILAGRPAIISLKKRQVRSFDDPYAQFQVARDTALGIVATHAGEIVEDIYEGTKGGGQDGTESEAREDAQEGRDAEDGDGSGDSRPDAP